VRKNRNDGTAIHGREKAARHWHTTRTTIENPKGSSKVFIRVANRIFWEVQLNLFSIKGNQGCQSTRGRGFVVGAKSLVS